MDCQNCSLHFPRNTFGENFCSKKTLSSYFFFRSVGENFWQDCQNCILNFHMNFYGGQICLNKLQDHCFSSDCGWKSYRRIVKTAFFSRKTIREEIFVRKNFYINDVSSFFSWKFCGRVVKTVFYNFRGTILGETFVWKSYRFKDFLRAAVEEVSYVLPKLHSRFPEEDFGRNFVFKKTHKFIVFLGLRVKNFLTG